MDTKRRRWSLVMWSLSETSDLSEIGMGLGDIFRKVSDADPPPEEIEDILDTFLSVPHGLLISLLQLLELGL